MLIWPANLMSCNAFFFNFLSSFTSNHFFLSHDAYSKEESNIQEKFNQHAHSIILYI
jgi:hypothetical protein